MTPPAPPQVECERIHPRLAVGDVLAAAEFYTSKLGFTLAFTWGEPVIMAGVDLGKEQVFLEQGTPNPEGIRLYFVVGDADELYEFQRANGVEVTAPPKDQEWGLRDYRIRDLNGYALEFGHYIHDAGEPVPIERVDVPVRLEKRLAALLHDLAAHKRMSVSSLLEEILLHTSEPLGDGVASPHTKSQLRHIQQLKQKHGIDYDTHASYRWVES
ncbi:MAG TPA: VOC family protein [Longimicrobium sp.]|nr:VOC family protein [Longimicrobium sp.]